MKLNLNEVFEAAKNIEKSGYTFYKEAAKKLPEHKEFLTFLANEEVGHEAVFDDLQKKSVNQEFADTLWNPDNVIGMYFEAMTDSVVFNKKSSEIESLFNRDNSIFDVIDWAIKREQDSVLFFTGLKESLKNSQEKDKIDSIISEEIKHIHLLMDKKSKLL